MRWPISMPAGSLALLAGATLSLLGLVAASAPLPAEEARVELEVAGVLPMPEGAGALLVLREKGGTTFLPVLVPGGDGAELRRRVLARRGGPPGLAGEALAALGAKVREVEIAAAEETSAGARVRIARDGRQFELAARPSESVALAVHAGAPIVARRGVLEEAGLTPEDLERARRKLDPVGGGRETRL